MQTWGGRINGHAFTPPIVPIFERQTVPSLSSLEVNLASEAKDLNLSSYYWIFNREQSCTFLIFGTTKPFGESIAILML